MEDASKPSTKCPKPLTVEKIIQQGGRPSLMALAKELKKPSGPSEAILHYVASLMEQFSQSKSKLKIDRPMIGGSIKTTGELIGDFFNSALFDAYLELQKRQLCFRVCKQIRKSGLSTFFRQVQ